MPRRRMMIRGEEANLLGITEEEYRKLKSTKDFGALTFGKLDQATNKLYGTTGFELKAYSEQIIFAPKEYTEIEIKFPWWYIFFPGRKKRELAEIEKELRDFQEFISGVLPNE